LLNEFIVLKNSSPVTVLSVFEAPIDTEYFLNVCSRSS